MRSGLVILSFLLSMPSGSLLAQALDPPAEPAEPSEPAPRRWMDRDRSASARREASVPATSTASTERSPGVRSGRRAIRTRAAGGPVDPCLVPGLIYASTMDELWVIDPDTLEATFLGPLPEETFDVGVTPDGRLIVSSNRGAEIHAIDTCDLSSTFLGALTESVNSIGPGLGPGLVLAPASSRLLELEVTATSVITTPVLPSDGWCSVPSGDAALSPCDGRLYVSQLPCSECRPFGLPPADSLVRLDPATGDAISSNCLETADGTPVSQVFGLAFDASGTLWGAIGPSPQLIQVEPDTGVVSFLDVTGGFPGAGGLAILREDVSCCPDDLDFDAIAAGETVVIQLPGVTVGGSHEVVGFDTTTPDCDDDDLRTPGDGTGNDTALGTVLVLQETDSPCRPDDDGEGGLMTLDFDPPRTVDWVGLLDIDEPGGRLRVLDAAGAVLLDLDLPIQEDNGWQRLDVGRDDVARLELELTGSGALSEVRCGP